MDSVAGGVFDVGRGAMGVPAMVRIAVSPEFWKTNSPLNFDNVVTADWRSPDVDMLAIPLSGN